MKKLTITAIVLASLIQVYANQGQNRPKPMSAEKLISQMDTNNDGQLSSDEVKGPLKNDFSKIDTNSDGYLSLDELKNAPRPPRGGRGQRPGNSILNNE